MKFKDFEMIPSLGKTLTVAMTLALVGAPVSTAYARPDVPPGQVKTTVYDYRDFTGPGVTQKQFVQHRSDGSEVDVTQRLIRPEPGELIIEHLRSANGVPLSLNVWYYYVTDTDFLWYRNEVLDPQTYEERFTENFSPPQNLRQSVMPEGVIHGDAVDVSATLDGEEIAKYGATRSNTALGLDDVEVPYGTFSDCLRMWEEAGTNHSVTWYCPGVGRTKIVSGNPDTRQVMELVDCVGCPDQTDE